MKRLFEIVFENVPLGYCPALFMELVGPKSSEGCFHWDDATIESGLSENSIASSLLHKSSAAILMLVEQMNFSTFNLGKVQVRLIPYDDGSKLDIDMNFEIDDNEKHPFLCSSFQEFCTQIFNKAVGLQMRYEVLQVSVGWEPATEEENIILTNTLSHTR